MTFRYGVIAWKELLQLRRDRMTLAMMVVMPLMQLMLFGYAINTDVRHIPTVVYDQDRSAAVARLSRSLEATGFYDIVGEVRDYDEIERALRVGTSAGRRGHPGALCVEPDAGPQHDAAARRRRLRSADRGQRHQHRRLAGGRALGRARARQARCGRRIRPRLGPAHLGRAEHLVQPRPSHRRLRRAGADRRHPHHDDGDAHGDGHRARARARHARAADRLAGDERRARGRQDPALRHHRLRADDAHSAGRAAWSSTCPSSARSPLLYALAFVFIAANLALGLFFSTLAKTQQQAMQMSFFFLLPNILLSGFMFPFEAMPVPAQWLSQALPLTHFLRIVRGITLKGSGFADAAPELVWLAGILGLLVLMASLRFSKKLA